MRRISSNLNPQNKRAVKNLHQVLQFLLPDVEFRDPTTIDAETEAAIRRVLEPREPILRERQLNPRLIDQLNQALVAKKYEDAQNISELHGQFQKLQRNRIIRREIDTEEINNNQIGRSTQAFIRTFQKRYKLSQTGEIDPATEARLESVLAGIAGSNPQPKKKLRVRNVTELTRVVRALRINHSGERVQHLQKGLAWLGYTILYEEYSAKTYGISTKNAVRQFQIDHQLPLTGRVDKSTARAINLEMGWAKPQILVCEKVRVRGSVRDELWEGKNRVTVRVYHKGLGDEETLLGERKTFSNGFYEVMFTPPYDPTQTPLHLTVKVFDGENELDAKPFYNAKKVVWMNFTEGDEPYQGLSEFDQLHKTLSPQLAASNLQIHDLEQSDRRQDILYLYRETGILPETILKLSLAHRIARNINQAELPPEVFYAFLRQNLPPELSDDIFPDEPKEWHEWLPKTLELLTNGLVFLESNIQQEALDLAFQHNLIPRRLKF